MITHSVSIAYKDIFDDYNNVDIKILLQNVPSKNALEIVAHCAAQIHTKERDNLRQIALLKLWTGRLPSQIHDIINHFLNKTQIATNVQFNFINNVSNLLLCEYIIENHNTLDPVSDLTPKQELDIFKAYLWCSQQWTDEQIPNEPLQIRDEAELAQYFIRLQFPYQELLEFKDFRMQFIKATLFFKFCEQNTTFKNYLNIFCSEHNVDSWRTYLVHILSIYIRKFEELHTPSRLKVGDEHKSVQDFLRYFSVNISDFKKSKDFIALRERPVYEIASDDFLFLNLNLLIDKLFQGVQFALFKALKKHHASYKGKLITKFDHFKSIYGEELSEKGLFYSVVKYAFENNDYNKIDGQTLKTQLNECEPDFYMRDKGKIYLMEYKDVIISAPVKHSYNFSIIWNELTKKYISNERGSPKGVTQLVNSIENIQRGSFRSVDAFDEGSVIIYPIIVFTDFVLNIAGVNYLLNKEMRSRFKEKSIPDGNVKDLVLLDLDDLVKFQDLFRSRKLKLNNCLNEYLEAKAKPPLINKLKTFTIFIHDKTHRFTDYTPKMLFKEAEELLSDESSRKTH